MNQDDTIVAPITSAHSPFRYALRISGPLSGVLRSKWFGAGPLEYASCDEYLDVGLKVEVPILSLTMPEGCSYTREDVWELHFDANDTVLAKVLHKVYSEGVRPAEPGEFTRRSFLNGRIDLDQAQAIAALVSAKGQEHRSQALKMMAGDRGDLLRELRHKLVSIRSHLEAVIDFPEEPDAYESRELWRKEWGELQDYLKTCLQQMSNQVNAESHLRVLVVGAANSGKSSFLKCMIPSAQPIVSNQAGTTLDLVPYSMEMAGQSILLYDTPGLKRSDGRLDDLSLGQLREKLYSFDAYILIEQEGEDLISELALQEDALSLKLLAKADLHPEIQGRVRWSALTREGEPDIKAQLLDWSKSHQKEEQAPWWSLRLQILQRGEETLEHLHQLLCEEETQEELAAYEIDEWLDMWDGILAEEKDSDALLDRVFREFCIGK